MEVLQQYQNTLGKKVNLDKSKMVFNQNIREEDKRIFQEKLPISIPNKITNEIKPQVHGLIELVIKEYRSNREL